MKQHKNNKPMAFSSNEEEFNSLSHMHYGFVWERSNRPGFFLPSGEASENLRRMKMEGVVFLFENGIHSGAQVLTEKAPEIKYERTRKYFEDNRIPNWLMRRWRNKPEDDFNLLPHIENHGFCLFGISEEQGHILARKFGAESFILHVMDPHLRTFLIGTRGSRFSGMRSTLYRVDDTREMIALQFVMYDNKFFHQVKEYQRLQKELKQLQPAKRKKRK